MPRFLRHRPLALLPVIHSSHACENIVLLNNWLKFLMYPKLLPNQVLVFIPASRLPLFALRDVAV